MKKTVAAITIAMAMMFALCSCGMDNNTVRPAKLDKGEQEVFDAINGYYTIGQLYEYKTDTDELVFHLDMKTKDGWKTVQTKKLKVYPEGYIYVNGDIEEGITISAKTVETKENDGIKVERHKVQFSKTGDMDMAIGCPEEGYAIGQDYIMLYTAKNHSIKNTDSNKKKAHIGDYGLMIDTVER